jgi:hypothetical protein
VFCRQARTRSCSSIPPGRALRVSVFTSALSTVVLRGGPARSGTVQVVSGAWTLGGAVAWPERRARPPDRPPPQARWSKRPGNKWRAERSYFWSHVVEGKGEKPNVLVIIIM